MSLIHLLHQAVIQLLRVTYYSSFLVGILGITCYSSLTAPIPAACSGIPPAKYVLYIHSLLSIFTATVVVPAPRLLPRQLQQPLSALLVSAFAIPCLNILHHNSYLLKTNVVLLHTLRLKSILFQWPARNYMISSLWFLFNLISYYSLSCFLFCSICSSSLRLLFSPQDLLPDLHVCGFFLYLAQMLHSQHFPDHSFRSRNYDLV